MPYRKPKHIFIRMGLVAILVGIFFWSYMMFAENFERVEMAQRMVDAVVENNMTLAHKYAEELGIAKENLVKTEKFLKDVQFENMKLKEKIALLDQLNQMDSEIGQLKQENLKLTSEIEKMRQDMADLGDSTNFEFGTVKEGRSLLAKFKEKIRGVKERLGFLKKRDHQEKVAVQKKIDEQETLLGNKGFLVKDGASTIKMCGAQKSSETVNVKVEFVK